MLEIQKRKIRDEIKELDDLKKMLQDKRGDYTSGFDELAESNKDLKGRMSSGEREAEGVRLPPVGQQPGINSTVDHSGGVSYGLDIIAENA